MGVGGRGAAVFEPAAVSVNITAYRWPHRCINNDLKISQPVTQAPLFKLQRASCVTPLQFPEIEFIRLCEDTVGCFLLMMQHAAKSPAKLVFCASI